MFLQFCHQYHDSLLAGHQGVTRMYLTLKEKCYANNLFNSIRKYVQSCHTCHTKSAKEPGYKAYHTRIPYDFRPMSRISADIKWMPLSNQGFNYILFATCEIIKLCNWHTYTESKCCYYCRSIARHNSISVWSS